MRKIFVYLMILLIQSVFCNIVKAETKNILEIQKCKAEVDLSDLISSAKRDDRESQFWLAGLYAMNMVCRDGEDEEKSIYWFERSAKNGRLEAFVEIGKIYEKRRPLDKEKIISYFSLAATKGSYIGQKEMGLRFYFGNTFDLNYEMAYYWLLRASKNVHDRFYDEWAKYFLAKVVDKLPQNRKNIIDKSLE